MISASAILSPNFYVFFVVLKDYYRIDRLAAKYYQDYFLKEHSTLASDVKELFVSSQRIKFVSCFHLETKEIVT